MIDKLITELVDLYLQRIIDFDINKLPRSIEQDMLDPMQETGEEWKKWLPLESRVTDLEIEEFEGRIGHKLPSDYVFFLKYKHFYALNIGEGVMCEHPVNTWRASLSAMIYNGYPRKFLIDKGLIPFAGMNDWGLLCFDTNRGYLNANYPVVLWDHEVVDWHTDYAPSFRMTLRRLDKDYKKRQEAGDE